MSDASNGKPTATFYILASVFLVWNLMGLMFYYMQVTMTPEVMAENFNDAQFSFMTNMPVWATSAYAIAVNAGIVGALLMLLRKSWAVHLFVLSLVAVLIQDLDAFVLRGAIEVWGSGGIVLPLLVIIICLAEIGYSRTAKGRGWLS